MYIITKTTGFTVASSPADPANPSIEDLSAMGVKAVAKAVENAKTRAMTNLRLA
jgi:hypothetical protein